MAFLDREAQRARRRHQSLRVITLVGCLLILTLASLATNAQLTGVWNVITHAGIISLSILVSASVGLETIFNFGARWRRLEHRLERLQAEGWRFLQLSGHYRHYDDHAGAFTAFSNQIEELSQREVEVYSSAVTRERRKVSPGQEAELPKKLEPPAQELPAATVTPIEHPTPLASPLARGASQMRR